MSTERLNKCMRDPNRGIKSIYTECICCSPDHTMRFAFFKDDPYEVWVEGQMNHFVWYKRLWHGIRYIFGKESKFGKWDYGSLSRKSIDDLSDFFEQHGKYYDAWQKNNFEDLSGKQVEEIEESE